MASGNGNGHVLKALSQPLDSISSAENVSEIGKVGDSSEFIDFILHSRQLFDLLVKACLAPFMQHLTACIYWSRRFIFPHAKPPTEWLQCWGLGIGCHLYWRCWTGYESWKALLRTWKQSYERFEGWMTSPPQMENWAIKNTVVGQVKIQGRQSDPDLGIELAFRMD